jgi:hypothetical protein
MKDAPSHNFHLPLPDTLYLRLRAEAQRARQPATSLARQALEAWLLEREKAVLAEEIAAYATACAGSGAELDPELERAALEQWPGPDADAP